MKTTNKTTENQHWQPDELAGWRVGDLADLPTLGRVQIAGLKPPSELLVCTRSGATVRVGWRALSRVSDGHA